MKLSNILFCTISLLSLSCAEQTVSNEPFRPDAPENKITLYESSAPTRRALVSYGEYLVKGPASCGFCHGDGTPNGELTGGRVFQGSVGEITAPALKDNPLLNSWSDEQLIKAIRTGEREGDSDIPQAMHGGFRWLSNSDLLAILSYLHPDNSPRKLKELDDLEPRGIFTKSFEGSDSSFEGYVPVIPRSTSIQYGRYLTFHLARCQLCHSSGLPLLNDDEAFAGKQEDNRGTMEKITAALRDGVSFTGLEQNNEAGVINFPGKGPNIRGGVDGELKDWSEDDIIQYLSSGQNKEGKQIDGAVCPWPFYKRMTPDDKRAVARYLKTL